VCHHPWSHIHLAQILVVLPSVYRPNLGMTTFLLSNVGNVELASPSFEESIIAGNADISSVIHVALNFSLSERWDILLLFESVKNASRKASENEAFCPKEIKSKK